MVRLYVAKYDVNLSNKRVKTACSNICEFQTIFSYPKYTFYIINNYEQRAANNKSYNNNKKTITL